MDNSRILKRLAKNPSGAVFYCRQRKYFFLNYNNKYQCYTAGQFIDLWEQLNEINLEEMLNNSSAAADIEIFNPRGTDYIHVLTITEIISLKSLINNSMDVVAPLKMGVGYQD